MMSATAIAYDGGGHITGTISTMSSTARLDWKRNEKYDDRQICKYITLSGAGRATVQEEGQ